MTTSVKIVEDCTRIVLGAPQNSTASRVGCSSRERTSRFRRRKKSVLFVQVFSGKMGTISSVSILGLFVLFASTTASSAVFDSVLGNTASCHKSCEMTYSLHTYPRVSTLDEESNVNVCQRQLTFSKLTKKETAFILHLTFLFYYTQFATNSL